jgi:phosphopantetheine--protein transferase-like protein
MAMAELGHSPCGIPSGPDRAPVWPLGLVGSITHSTDFCAAVVARSDCFRTVGIDAEPIDAIPAELVEEILRPDEASEFNSKARPDGADWPTLYFCLKEAAYKALQALPGARDVGWQHLEVERETEGRPTLILLGPARELAERFGPLRIELSLSHSEMTAGAVAVLIRDGQAIPTSG